MPVAELTMAVRATPVTDPRSWQTDIATADAVFGSRMMTRGAALKGGMPMYKFVGNKILTRLQNGLAGLDPTERHRFLNLLADIVSIVTNPKLLHPR